MRRPLDGFSEGGYNGAAPSNLVYSAEASITGFGPYVILPGYPYVVWSGSCVLAEETIVCVGGGSKGGTTLAAVRYLQGSDQGATSSTASSVSVTRASAVSTETPSGTQSGVPELPFGWVAAVTLAALVVISYAAARSRAPWRRNG